MLAKLRRYGLSPKETMLTSLLALSAGGMLYLLFRPRGLVLFRAVDRVGLTDTVDAMRRAASATDLPEWVVYCLPNGLWSLAYVLIAAMLMRGRTLPARLAVAGIIPVVGLVSELMQRVGLLRGTFDWGDVAAYALPFVIYLIINILIYSKNEVYK
ncbi:MAG: hypothetical protein J6Y82_05295 [Bacteroidales bacterium]|nr:hypothetical protein [Bacteroidales bacterium]